MAAEMSFKVYILLLLIILILTAALWKVVYNVLLHPLKKIPGPKLWAATRIPWCWYQYQGKLPQKLFELHLKYGHAVRIAPHEISYTTDTAWKTIYGQRPVEMRKDPIFSLLTPTGAQNILVADRETHTRQRRLLSHAFSEKALREQESILRHHVDKFIRRLNDHCDAGPINIVAWFNFLTFDLIGDMTFGDNFGCIDRGDYVPFVAEISAMATELTFNQMWKYWGLLWLKRYLVPKNAAGKRADNIKRAMAAVGRRMAWDTARKDFMHYILTANDEKGMSPEEIHVNAFSLNIAGSESTATAMSGVIFFALTHGDVLDKLTAEVRGKFSSEDDITISSTKELEYMEAVILETLRLYPPVAITMPRRTPFGGETIDGFYVTEEITVGVNPYSAYRHPDNFYKGGDFLPQRWLAANHNVLPYLHDNRACVQPFSYGPRNCLGKNLAWAEMRLTLATLLFEFDIELVGGQGDWQRSQIVQGFWQKPPLQCLLKPIGRVE